jgi:hypothetical protein
MSRSWCRVKPADEQVLIPVQKSCPECGRAMRIRYTNRRAVVSLRGLVCLRLKIRHCENRACGRYHQGIVKLLGGSRELDALDGE